MSLWGHCAEDNAAEEDPKSLKSPEMTNKNVLTTAVLGQDGDINIKELNIGISLTTSYSTIPS